ncbi:MAG: hypothetical protein R2798_01445 [Chitinophagales bacterium]
MAFVLMQQRMVQAGCCPACLAGAEFADTTYACDGLSRLDLDAYADLTLVNEYPANAVLNWTFVVNSGAPIVDMTDLTSVNITHSGVGCDAENVTFTLTIDCVSDPNLDLIAGTHTVYVYPTLDATDIVDGSTTCSAEVTPVVACAGLISITYDADGVDPWDNLASSPNTNDGETVYYEIRYTDPNANCFYRGSYIIGGCCEAGVGTIASNCSVYCAEDMNLDITPTFTAPTTNPADYVYAYIITDLAGNIISVQGTGSTPPATVDISILANNASFNVYAVHYLIADDPVTGAANISNIQTAIANGDCVELTGPLAFDILSPITLTAMASCTGAGGVAAADGEYYIAVTAVSGGSPNYEISVQGEADPAQVFSGTTLYFGPYTHSGTGLGTKTLLITDDNDMNGSCSDCTATYEVLEALCPIAENSCDCTNQPNSGTLIAQSSPGTFNTDGYTQVYVLVENDGTYNGAALAVGTVIDANHTGLFDMLENGDYQVYAVNVLDGDVAALESALLGATGTLLSVDADVSDNDNIANLVAMVAPYDILCYTQSFADFTINCNCCVADAGNIVRPTGGVIDATTGNQTICLGDDLGAFTNVYTIVAAGVSDETDPGTTDYETTFLLTNTAGEILQIVPGGDFDFSTLAVGTYDVYVLNYATANTPNTVAAYLAALAAPANISEIVSDDDDTSSLAGTAPGTGTYCLDLAHLDDDDIDANSDAVQVTIVPLPIANAVVLEQCDDDTNSGNSMGFNLNASEDASNSINVNGVDVDNSGDATTGGLTVTYHTSLAEAEAGTNALNPTNPYLGTDGEIIYVRVEDVNGCYVTSTVTLNILPLPILVAQTPEICADANPYDLTSLESAMTGAAGSFAYAEGGVAVADATSYTAVDGAVVEVTFTDGTTGCENTTTITFTVNPLPILVAQTPEICVDANPYDLTSLESSITSDAGIFAYAEGGVAVADPTNYTAVDGAVVEVTFTDGTTGCENTTTITFTVNPLPILVAQTPEICVDANPYDLTSLESSITGDAGSFAYAEGGVAVADASNYTALDGAVVEVTFTDGTTGCENTTTITFTVNPLPILVAQTPEICVDANPYDLTSLESSITGDVGSFAYAEGGVAVADASNYTALDGAVVEVTFTDGTTGCENTTTITFTVNPLPILVAQTPEICVDANPYDLTSLEGSITGDAGSFAYAEGGTAVVDPTSYTALDGAVVDVTFTDSTTGCENTTTITFTVNPLPIANAVILEQCDDDTNSGNSMGFNLNASEDAGNSINVNNVDVDNSGDATTGGLTVTYHTSLADAESGTNAINPTNPYLGMDDEVLYVRVADGNGCYATTTVTLNILPAIQILATAICTTDGTTPVTGTTYYVAVSSVTGGNGGDYDVSIGATTQTFTGSTLYFGPFNYVNGAATQTVMAVDAGIVSAACSASIEVTEIDCEAPCVLSPGTILLQCTSYCAEETTATVTNSFIPLQRAQRIIRMPMLSQMQVAIYYLFKMEYQVIRRAVWI